MCKEASVGGQLVGSKDCIIFKNQLAQLSVPAPGIFDPLCLKECCMTAAPHNEV